MRQKGRLNILSNMQQMGVRVVKYLVQLTTTTKLGSHDLTLGGVFSQVQTLYHMEYYRVAAYEYINSNKTHSQVSEPHRKMCEIRTIYHRRKCSLHELIKQQKEESVSTY